MNDIGHQKNVSGARDTPGKLSTNNRWRRIHPSTHDTLSHHACV